MQIEHGKQPLKRLPEVIGIQKFCCCHTYHLLKVGIAFSLKTCNILLHSFNGSGGENDGHHTFDLSVFARENQKSVNHPGTICTTT